MVWLVFGGNWFEDFVELIVLIMLLVVMLKVDLGDMLKEWVDVGC